MISLGMVLTPGPNMMYLISRTLSQDRRAGLISLVGVGLGLLCYVIAAGLGLSALFKAVPLAFNIVRIGGAGYLAYLAWTLLKPNGTALFSVKQLSNHSSQKLFLMGLTTSVLNPKAVLLYSALIPQFIDPLAGETFIQFVQLGLIQVTISVTVNGLIVLAASKVSSYLTLHPFAMTLQRWVCGLILLSFAIQLFLQKPL